MKHSLGRSAVILSLCALLFTSCAAHSKNHSEIYDTDESYFDSAAQTESSGMPTESNGSGFTSRYGSYDYEAEAKDESFSAPASTEETPDTPSRDGRKIIYSSWFDINTEEYDESVGKLNALCKKYGAYYESAQSYGDKTYSNRYATYVVRVPKEHYFEFIESAGTLGMIVGSGENNRDVTEQYFDTEARLESATLRETRLLDILEKADTLDDVLQLERELADVRYEIESYTGELKKLDSLVSYSTATVNINEVRAAIVPDSDKQPLGTRLSLSLSRGWESFRNGAANFAIDLMYDLPVILCIWLPILIIVIVLIVILRKKRKKRRERRLSAQNPISVPTDTKEIKSDDRT